MSGLHLVISNPPEALRGQGFKCGWYCDACGLLLTARDGETVTCTCGEAYIVEER
jgi:hypothetical protein